MDTPQEPSQAEQQLITRACVLRAQEILTEILDRKERAYRAIQQTLGTYLQGAQSPQENVDWQAVERLREQYPEAFESSLRAIRRSLAPSRPPERLYQTLREKLGLKPESGKK